MMIVQIFLGLLGVVAIWLAQQNHNPDWSKYASIPGILAQPCWFYVTYESEQWGIFILSFFYTYVWGLSFYGTWIRKNK